ncbi:Serine/threonine-protein kinase, partial [Coemansia brasiliensis]
MPSNAELSGSPQQRTRATVAIGDYELGAQIGRGSFATVYRGVNKKTNELVAVKSVVRSSLTRRLLDNLETEINILRTVKHPSIVELLDCLKSRNHIHLVMEYCSLGDLAGYMRKGKKQPLLANSFGGLKMNVARSFVFQLGSAMQFLRARDIIHRDIKTQNILLQPPSSDYQMGESEARGIIPWIKVADFGFARNLPSTALAETLCGSPLYMAPEILHYEPYDARADLWSIGAVTYEIMTGKPPFNASNHVELARVIERTKDKISFPDEQALANGSGEDKALDPLLKDLVRQLLKMHPNDRMQFEDFFAHPALTAPQQQQPAAAASSGAESVQTATSSEGIKNPPITASPHTNATNYAQQSPIHKETTDNRNMAVAPVDNLHITTAVERMAVGGNAAQHRTLHSLPENRQPAYPPLPPTQHLHHTEQTSKQDAAVSDHERRASLAEEEQAMAEREYVVIEKRAVEMNVLADEL